MSQLDQPLPLPCGVTLPHRIALAPLTNTQSDADGTLSPVEAAWLQRRAGHFGLLSTCATFVSEEGHAWPGQLGLAHDAHRDALAPLARALTDAGSVPIVQLHHGGKEAKLAPQRLSTADGDGIRGATHDDLHRVTAEFVAAAVRAEQAGFAGVEVHGANGYLFTQFLAPADNPRTDEYGGSLAGRARFLLDTMRAVRAATSQSFAVGVRISPVDTWARRGLRLQDSVQLVQWLAEAGADFVHLSLRDAAGPARFEPEHKAPVARVLRDALPAQVPLVVAGGVSTRADAVRAESAGADVVALGRAAIVHPDWPQASLAPDFAPLQTPWEPDYLRSVAVGEPLLAYIGNFPGMVVGGAPPRG